MTTPKHTIYIAGKMSGLPFYNFPAFDAARDKLLAEGWEVISPADLDRAFGFDAIETPDMEVSKEFLADARRRDIEAIEGCRAIFMLTGWENSVGACAELAYAQWCGCEVVYQTPKGASSESILEEAIHITSGARRRDYDKATPNHIRIAEAWNWYLDARKNPGDITAFDVSMMMVLLKISRLCCTLTRDSLVDIAGYAKCGSQIAGFESE